MYTHYNGTHNNVNSAPPCTEVATGAGGRRMVCM